MKFLIWFLGLCIPSFLTVSLNKKGIYLGAIPTFILYGIAFSISGLLCKKWERYSIAKAASKLGMTSFEYVKTQIPSAILSHLESEKDHHKGVEEYLKNSSKNGLMSKAFADILIDGYTK